MKRKVLLVLMIALFAVTGLTACKDLGGLSAPVGKSGDYTKIEVSTAKEPYQLSKGTGYYLKRPLPKSAYYMGARTTNYEFVATEDVKVYYSEKLQYDTTSSVDARRPDRVNSYGNLDIEIEQLKKGSKDLKTSTDLKAGDSLRVSITVYKYKTEASTAAEFYVWAE